MLELRNFRYFLMLAEELHFGRAADRLNVAQSVLSVQIKRLEDSLGAPLLHRRTRAAVTLTRAGEVFLGEARAVVAGVERAERIGQFAGRGEAGPLKLGYVFSAAICGVLPAALRALGAQLPLVKVEPLLMETPEQLAAIADRRIDMGLIRPRPNYPAGVAAIEIQSEDLVLAFSESHPLANAPSVAPPALRHETFILPQFHENTGLIDNLNRLAAASGFPIDRLERTKDFVTALSIAAGGHGVVLAPASLRNIHIDGLVFRPIEDHQDRIVLTLAYGVGDVAPVVSAAVKVLEML